MISNKVVEKFNLHASGYQLGASKPNNCLVMFALALSRQDTTVFIADCDTNGDPMTHGKYLVLCNWNYHIGGPAFISFFDATEEFLLDASHELIINILYQNRRQIKSIEPVVEQKPQDLSFKWDFTSTGNLLQ